MLQAPAARGDPLEVVRVRGAVQGALIISISYIIGLKTEETCLYDKLKATYVVYLADSH